MKKSFFFIINVILLINSSAQSSTRIHPEDDEIFLALARQYPAVGKIIVPSKFDFIKDISKLDTEQIPGNGSGTLVSCSEIPSHLENRVVLTAAHVIYNVQQKGVYSPVYFQLEGSKPVLCKSFVHPSFQGSFEGVDLAVLILEAPAENIKPMPINWYIEKSTLLDQSISIVGYGKASRFMQFHIEKLCPRGREVFCLDFFHVTDCCKRGSTSKVLLNSELGVLSASPFKEGAIINCNELYSCSPSSGLLGKGDSGGLCAYDKKIIGVNIQSTTSSPSGSSFEKYSKKPLEFISINFKEKYSNFLDLLEAQYPERYEEFCCVKSVQNLSQDLTMQYSANDKINIDYHIFSQTIETEADGKLPIDFSHELNFMRKNWSLKDTIRAKNHFTFLPPYKDWFMQTMKEASCSP